jgi:hypothetical protein
MFRSLLILAFIFLGITNCTQESATTAEAPVGAENMAYRWGKVALKATANDTDRFKPRPTITSRYLGLIFTAAFDAWTRYDETATPVYLAADVKRRPAAEQTLENKEKAISYAFYRTMSEYYYSDTTLFKSFMTELGFDPADNSTDPTTPVGIGNLAAQQVIAKRHNDGANQYAEEEGSNGVSYFDYTNYHPVNSPDENVEIARWQPKYFADGKGGKFAPACLTPHWNLVEPIALDSPSQLRPGPPPAIGSDQLAKEVKDVIDMQANLTNEQKALVEFMRDGPSSVQQAGHWLIFAQNISVRDQHTLDDDIKMYFLNQITAMDAFIACWDSKMHYDFARPNALIHDYYQDEIIKAWAGPEVGMTEVKGKEWRPYSPDTFLCPPFPSYVSGHSTVSGACAKALELFTGRDTFGVKVKLVPGIMTELPENYGDTVTLDFPTLTKTADMAGISRVFGGYHIQADNVEGIALGRRVAQVAFDFYNKHVNGGTGSEM